MIEIIGGQFSAGETKTFMVNGEYLEILDAQYACDVFMMDRNGGQVSSMLNAEASFFSRPGSYGVVQIKSAQAQFIRCFIGSGDAGTRRISSTVQVVDGELARTKAGVMFAACGTQGAVAGQASRVQLWNPSLSGKRLIVGALSMSSNVALSFNVCYTQAAEATDITANFALSKLGGGAAGAALLRTGTNAAVLTQSMFGASGAANQNVPWTPKGAIVVPPGYGLVAFSGTVNAVLSANFEWFEEAI